jgi:hypothetical protein
MNKKVISGIVVFGILVSLVAVSTVFAKFVTDGQGGGKYKVKAGNSSISHLYLYQKDPSDWSIVEGGAWGKLTYNTDTGDFVFNGHRLEANISYTLIDFARDTEWPAHINELGNGTTNNGGNLHITGNYTYANLEYDETPDTGGTEGYKIWLVLSEDIDADGNLAGWNPEEYLFEHNLLP